MCKDCVKYNNKKVYKDYRFCPICGSRLEEQTIQYQQIQELDYDNPVIMNNRNLRGPGTWVPR